jgi:hypothetical protein
MYPRGRWKDFILREHSEPTPDLDRMLNGRNWEIILPEKEVISTWAYLLPLGGVPALRFTRALGEIRWTLTREVVSH